MKRTCLILGAALVMGGDGLAAPTSSDIDQFFRVNAQVSTGGQPTHEQLSALKAEGVRGIVNLREPEEHDIEEEATVAKDLGLHYISIPVSTAAPRDEQVKTFLKVTNDPEVFPLFIQCASGNRVGAFWMIRRVLVDGWTVERAEEEAKRIGLRSPNLLDFARDYIERHAKEAPGSSLVPLVVAFGGNDQPCMGDRRAGRVAAARGVDSRRGRAEGLVSCTTRGGSDHGNPFQPPAPARRTQRSA